MAFDTFDVDPVSSLGVTFSGGNLIATGGATINGIAQALEGKKSGKWYVEFTATTINGANDNIGIINSWGLGQGHIGYNPTFAPSTDAGWAFTNGGDIINENTPQASVNAAPYSDGDVIGLALDLDNATAWWRLNTGSWIGTSGSPNPATNTSGFDISHLLSGNCRVYPGVSLTSVGTTFTANFGASAFIGSVPSGFTSGWTNTTAGTYFGTFATTGTGVIQGFSAPPQNDKAVSAYVSNFTGYVQHVIFPFAGANVVDMKAVIYDDTGAAGLPGARLGVSTNIVNGTGNYGEQTFSFSGVSLTSGSTYWIGLVSDGAVSTTQNVMVGPTPTNGVAYNSGTYASPTNPFGASPSQGTFRYPLLVFPQPVMASALAETDTLVADLFDPNMSGNLAEVDTLSPSLAALPMAAALAEHDTIAADLAPILHMAATFQETNWLGGVPDPQLLASPGFEAESVAGTPAQSLGDFQGWTVTGDPVDGIPFMLVAARYDGILTPSGDQYVNSGFYGATVGPVGGVGAAGAPGFLGAGFLSQIVDCVPGDPYVVTFSLCNPSMVSVSGQTMVEVVLDGTIVPFTFTTTGSPVSGHTVTGGTVLLHLNNIAAFSASGWNQYSASFTATAPTHFISFSFRNDSDFFGFDDARVVGAEAPAPALAPFTCWAPRAPTVAPPLGKTIPSYLYTEYNDDDSVRAFVTAYNQMTQRYVQSFLDLNLPIYPYVSGKLLDWVAAGLYGFPTRPTLVSGTLPSFGPYNTEVFNDNNGVYNGQYFGGALVYTPVSDDIFRRIITWAFYKGDGKVFDIRWLKRRIARFLFADANCLNPNIDQTYQISIDFGPGNIVYIRLVQNVYKFLGDALYDEFAYNTTPYEGNTQIVTSYPAIPLAEIFRDCVNGGFLELPFQFQFVVQIT